ncbi:hypothetical protein [Rhodopseudomonas palustris]|uniref:hypothetical protein n=1 Tax=Rhodopseudomonas palustris TaxID=1076 RepID=UPI00005D973C
MLQDRSTSEIGTDPAFTEVMFRSFVLTGKSNWCARPFSAVRLGTANGAALPFDRPTSRVIDQKRSAAPSSTAVWNGSLHTKSEVPGGRLGEEN